MQVPVLSLGAIPATVQAAMSTTQETTIAIVFTAKLEKELLEWIRKTFADAGLRLVLQDLEPASDQPPAAGHQPESCESSELRSPSKVALVTSTSQALMRAAEKLQIRKTKKGEATRPIPFVADDYALYATTDGRLFTPAEEVLLLNFALDEIKADPEEFEDVQPAESVVSWCRRQGYTSDMFPLHDQSAIDRIRSAWSPSRPWYNEEGLERLRDYFGDKVALYFCFLGFYTQSVLILAVAGLIVTMMLALLPSLATAWICTYSIFVCMWGVVTVSLWRRKNIDLVYYWRHLVPGDEADEKILTSSLHEEFRESFQGFAGGDPRSSRGSINLEFPMRERIKRTVISWASCVSVLIVAVVVLRLALDFQDLNDGWIANSADKYFLSRIGFVKGVILANLPLVVYMGSLFILNELYTKLATIMNDYENHKFDYEYDNAMILKLVLWNFFYLNMSYVYLAFVRRDVSRVTASLRTILITEAIIGNIKENVIPIVKRRLTKKTQSPGFEIGSRVNQIKWELTLEEPDDVFSDYGELLKQFTQITVFASAVPLGAALAAVNNLVEIWSDTYKYCKNQRRVVPRRAISLGSWIVGFEIMSILSIISNLGIMAISISSRIGAVDPFRELLTVVILEHLLMVARSVVQRSLGGIPTWVRDSRRREKSVIERGRPKQE